MANNNYNYIEITGDKKQLNKLYKDLVLDPKSGCNSGFDIYGNLCIKYGKFGNDARWFDMDVHFEENGISISGDSAWCPCLEIFTKISEKFPKLAIKYSYEEMGCDFSGWANIENGVCDDNCFTYWEGIIAREGEGYAFGEVIENELESYESEEELIESTMYLAFSEESRAEILKSYKESIS
jgi:hypothetical protein